MLKIAHIDRREQQEKPEIVALWERIESNLRDQAKKAALRNFRKAGYEIADDYFDRLPETAS